MTKRHYTHTICQFQLRPDLRSWSAVIFITENETKGIFVRDNIDKNTDLICGDQVFWKISDLMAYLEAADFSTPSDELPRLIRGVADSDVLKSGSDSHSESEDFLTFKRELAHEKQTRIKYQSVVYEICNIIDNKVGGFVTSDEVVRKLKEMLEGDQS